MVNIHVRPAFEREWAEVAALTVAGFDGPRRPDAARLALLRDAAGRAASGTLLVAQDETSGALAGTASLLRAGTPYARLARPGEAELRLLASCPRSAVGASPTR